MRILVSGPLSVVGALCADIRYWTELGWGGFDAAGYGTVKKMIVDVSGGVCLKSEKEGEIS